MICSTTRRTLVRVACVSLVLAACKTSDFAGESKKEAEVPPLETKSFVQNPLEPRSVTVTQGKKGASSNESYSVTSKGILDLLIVVDNSGSMAQEQENLSNRIVPLLSAVKDSDWQIAVTTTDPSDRCVSSLIQKGDFFVETRFKSAIRAGSSGDGVERPILRAVEGLKSQCLFGPGKWVRPNSTLAVLIITDEDNCHIDLEKGYGCTTADKAGSYLTDYIKTIRKIGTEARVYGLFWHPSQAQSQCSTALKSANIISEVVTATSGTWGSICDADYSATLSKISSDVAQILSADFTLKSVPDAGTFKMTVGGQPWTKFTLTGTVVHFTETPPKGSAIAVTYKSGAAGLVTNEFDLPSVPVDGSVTAKVGTTSAGTVIWDPAKKKAVFSQLPPEGSVITINYQESGTLKDTFLIAPGADPGHVRVAVSGKAVPPNDFTYDGATGAIKFKVIPPAGAKIDVSWRGPKKTTSG